MNPEPKDDLPAALERAKAAATELAHAMNEVQPITIRPIGSVADLPQNLEWPRS